ncbi:hypothetical protein QE357_004336 [Siphonobacter sp. BAB-5404]|nr:hypothetical protein [Siphonobacter sp. SORGH_AS_0500]
MSLSKKPQDLMNDQDTKNINILQWLQEWYQSQCNGDWEHQYGISINTLDNLGWDLKIDIYNTELEGLEIDYQVVEVNENDWYGFKADRYKYEAFGDPTKLETLIKKFKEIVESISISE